jgi:hypothetical protein
MSTKPTPSKSPPQPRAVYIHGLYFLMTETELRKQIDKEASLQAMYQYPGTVMCAFASELFLKCLILLEGGTLSKKHNLLTLYNQLSAKSQALVERHWDDGCRARKDSFEDLEKKFHLKIPRDLKTALDDCGDAFEQMRYVYEDPSKAKFYITHLPTSLHFAIREVTGWNP